MSLWDSDGFSYVVRTGHDGDYDNDGVHLILPRSKVTGHFTKQTVVSNLTTLVFRFS